MKEFEITQGKRFSLNLNELWQFKELFYFFTWRDIKIKYKQTALGFLWAILQPALMMILFTFLFGRIIPSKSPIQMPYPIFVYTGLMLWTLFASGIQNAGNSMVANSNIIKKIYFPRLIIPISSILVSIFDFFIMGTLYFILLFYFKVKISVLHLLLYFPLASIITVLTTFGIGTLLSALNVKYRDFRYIIPFLIQFLMFATPVFYPENIIDNKQLKIILNLNPLSSAINLARSAVDLSPVDWNQVIIGLITAVILSLVGVVYFRKTESYFADLS